MLSKRHRRRLNKIPTEPCATPEHLHVWIAMQSGLHIPRTPVCPNHHAPFDYLCKAYFEPAGDLIVWAPRGGGKTRLAALATLLDLLHKPGCAVRILGGSLDQSLKLWEHLLPALEDVAPDLMDAFSDSKRIVLNNRSSAAVLTQSQRAVRGLRVQKLRCDEVELFDPQIWEAAQLVTRSIDSSPHLAASLATRSSGRAARKRGANTAAKWEISGAIEAISTFHSRGGLMGIIIDRAIARGSPVIHWCLLEVLEKCPPERDCASCPLWEECGGVAKTKCEGFFKIDDAIRMKHRVSLETWQSEMLCKRPSLQASVFPHFDRAIHVKADVSLGPVKQTSLAIDFGFHNPFVCLWIVDDGVRCFVVDEYIQPQRTISDHLEQIHSRSEHGSVRLISCDPTGAGKNDQTAESNLQFLRRSGFKVHTRHSRIVEGLELIRAALRPAAGNASLFIHPKCKHLIAALEELRYPSDGGELPLKDGTHDHPIDALRYFFVNRGSRRVIEARGY